jgi:hypothetical protein
LFRGNTFQGPQATGYRGVDDTDGLAMGGGDGPAAALEVHLVVGVAAAVVEREVQVEQGRGWEPIELLSLKE